MKFIFVIILIFLFIRLVAPTLLRWLLQAFVKKQMRNGNIFNPQQQQRQQPFDNSYQQANQRAEGKVKIDYIPQDQNKKGFDGGEYVDYEEIK